MVCVVLLMGVEFAVFYCLWRYRIRFKAISFCFKRVKLCLWVLYGLVLKKCLKSQLNGFFVLCVFVSVGLMFCFLCLLCRCM